MNADEEAEALIAKYGTISRVGTKCAISLLAPDIQALIVALSSRGMQDMRTIRILAAEKKVRVTESSLGRHRRGQCQCPRE